jgi:hypothetical protein
MATDGQYILIMVYPSDGGPSPGISVFSAQTGDLVTTILNPEPGAAFGNFFAVRDGRVAIGAPSPSGGKVWIADITATGNSVRTTQPILASDPAVSSQFRASFGTRGDISPTIATPNGVAQFVYLPVLSPDGTQAAVCVAEVVSTYAVATYNAVWLAWVENNVRARLHPPLLYSSRRALRSPHAGSVRYAAMKRLGRSCSSTQKTSLRP